MTESHLQDRGNRVVGCYIDDVNNEILTSEAIQQQDDQGLQATEDAVWMISPNGILTMQSGNRMFKGSRQREIYMDDFTKGNLSKMTTHIPVYMYTPIKFTVHYYLQHY